MPSDSSAGSAWPPEPARVRAVCARPLDRLSVPGEPDTWIHAGSWGGEDHPPVPVTHEEITPLPTCDFCSGEPVVCQLPVTGVIWTSPIPASRNPWTACDPCATLISTDQWERLTDRAARRMLAAAGLEETAFPAVRAQIAPVYRQIRAQAAGPIEPLPR